MLLNLNYKIYENIYPKNKNDIAKMSEKGIYIIKVYFNGQWRSLYINDEIPCDENNQPLYPISSNPNEIWPLLICKAIHQLYPNLDHLNLSYILYTFGGFLSISKDIISNDIWHNQIKKIDLLNKDEKIDNKEKSKKI